MLNRQGESDVAYAKIAKMIAYIFEMFRHLERLPKMTSNSSFNTEWQTSMSRAPKKSEKRKVQKST